MEELFSVDEFIFLSISSVSSFDQQINKGMTDVYNPVSGSNRVGSCHVIMLMEAEFGALIYTFLLNFHPQ